MKGPKCQHENDAGAEFCEECAVPVPRACANCGSVLSPTAKFCPECAHPTGLAPAQRAANSLPPGFYTPKHLVELGPPRPRRWVTAPRSSIVLTVFPGLRSARGSGSTFVSPRHR